MKIPVVVCTTVTLAVVVASWASLSTRPASGEPGKWKAMLLSPVVEHRVRAEQTVAQERDKTIKFLLSVVDRPLEEHEDFYLPTSRRNIAIRLLGKLRAAEAAPALVGWLVMKPGQIGVVLGEPFLSPAARSLVMIGLPAVPSVLRVLKKEGPSAEAGSQALRTIAKIKGKEETKFFLERQLAREGDPKTKANIAAALNVLKGK